MSELVQEKKAAAVVHGDFVWYELMTSDLEAAETFYCRVVGWGARDSGLEDKRYILFIAGETPMGGMLALPSAGCMPGWMGYIAVDDVDRCAARVEQLGGKVHRPAEDIPGVGRFSVVADPQGAVFVLFKGNSATPPQRPAAGAQGFAGWHELYATKWQSAFAFYAELFGWRKTEAIDMGPAGTYQTFSANEEPMTGGMMTKLEGKPERTPESFWLFYFNVESIQAAVNRANAEGGQVVHGPVQVPGGQWIAQCRDPQGALFALLSSNA